MAFLPAVVPALASAFATLAPTLATAGAAGTAAMGAGTLATAASAAGSFLTGIGEAQKSLFASRLAEANAITARRAGQREEEVSKLKYGGLEAEQKVAQAANGVQVDSGSPEAVRRSTAIVGSLDAAMIHYNALKDSHAYRAQAQQDRAQAAMSIIGGTLDAGNNILAGANSLGGKWDAFRQKGVGFTDRLKEPSTESGEYWNQTSFNNRVR